MQTLPPLRPRGALIRHHTTHPHVDLATPPARRHIRSRRRGASPTAKIISVHGRHHRFVPLLVLGLIELLPHEHADPLAEVGAADHIDRILENRDERHRRVELRQSRHSLLERRRQIGHPRLRRAERAVEEPDVRGRELFRLEPALIDDEVRTDERAARLEYAELAHAALGTFTEIALLHRDAHPDERLGHPHPLSRLDHPLEPLERGAREPVVGDSRFVGVARLSANVAYWSLRRTAYISVSSALVAVSDAESELNARLMDSGLSDTEWKIPQSPSCSGRDASSSSTRKSSADPAKPSSDNSEPPVGSTG